MQVESYVEEKGWSMQIPFMHFDDYKEEVTVKFGMKHLLEQITQYLHDVGKVSGQNIIHNNLFTSDSRCSSSGRLAVRPPQSQAVRLPAAILAV